MPRYKSYRSSYLRRREKPVSKRRRTFRQKMAFAWKLTKILVLLSIVALVAVFYHFRSIDRTIAEKFDRPRKWDLPSRVYSDAEYFYPGISLRDHDITAKLDRLGYRNVNADIKGPGEFSKKGDSLQIYLHDFEYPGESFKGFPVDIRIGADKIISISNMSNGETLPLIRLEPEEVASIFNEKMEDRTVVTLQEVPENLIEAVILIEDERFFKHSGVDPFGIVRAALVNLKSMRIAQGGSTLTQQLVKNFFLHSKKSFIRKFNEMLIATRIEKKHSKAEILEAYLNEIYLGQRGYSSVSGVAEASKLYFGKNVGQLSTGECALLAGMIRLPSRYNPITNPESAKERRDFVLKRMLNESLISIEEYNSAIAEKIVTPKRREKAGIAPYFIDFVKRQLSDFYPSSVLQTEGLKIFTTLDIFYQLAAEESVSKDLVALEKDYANILPAEHEGLLQACLIAMQPSTGYVKALVGGRNYGESQFDRCTQAMRQPGSTFKPFVYLTALDPSRSRMKFTPASLIEDRSFEVKSGGQMWSPSNYNRKEHGTVTLRRALEQSLNIATARLSIDAGLENVVRSARDAGITSELMAVPSLSLGSFELTPMELASAYTIFPNSGIRTSPISIISVMTKEGQVLERKEIRMKRSFDPAPVYLTTHLMKGVMDSGTGAGARARGFTAVAAGKTGTTSSYKDAWFVGFTPNLLALSWVGYDDNAEMKMSGGRAALPIWTDFMKRVEPEGSGDFTGPQDVVLVKVDKVTGGLADRSCPQSVYEAFIKGTEPSKQCSEISLISGRQENF